MSATPMLDNPIQIIPILNILSHKSQQIPINTLFSNNYFSKEKNTNIPKITPKGSSLIQALSKGKVSFLDIDNTNFPKIIEKGSPLNNNNSVKIIKCQFDKTHQLKYFLDVYNNDSGYYNKSSRASLLVFPDGSYGKGNKINLSDGIKENTAFYKYFKRITY